MIRFLVMLCSVLAAWTLSPAADARLVETRIGDGLRLIMVDDVGCSYCRKWDEEVGVAYPQSAEGRLAPLERRPKRHTDLHAYEPLAYTPTFLLVRDGREIGRIVGYPGADFFWGELSQLLAKSGSNSGPAIAPAPQLLPRDAHVIEPFIRRASCHARDCSSFHSVVPASSKAGDFGAREPGAGEPADG